MPGVAALDAARAVRPTRADNGHDSGAPPVLATRRDEPVQSAEAPQVAAELDRPGLAFRPDAEIQRPVAPSLDVAKPKPWLWIAAAVLLGVVLAVAAAAILMRQKPQDLAIKPAVEAQKLAAPQPAAKIAERVEPPPPASLSQQRPRADRKRPSRALKAQRRQPIPLPKRRTRPPRRRRRRDGRRCWSPQPTIRRSRS